MFVWQGGIEISFHFFPPPPPPNPPNSLYLKKNVCPCSFNWQFITAAHLHVPLAMQANGEFYLKGKQGSSNALYAILLKRVQTLFTLSNNTFDGFQVWEPKCAMVLKTDFPTTSRHAWNWPQAVTFLCVMALKRKNWVCAWVQTVFARTRESLRGLFKGLEQAPIRPADGTVCSQKTYTMVRFLNRVF